MIEYRGAKAGSPQPVREGTEPRQQEMEFGDGSEEEFGLIEDESGARDANGQQIREPKLMLEDVGIEKATERLR